MSEPAEARAPDGRVTTADGVPLAVRWLAGPEGTQTCVVVAHGFTGSIDKPKMRAVAEGLARHAAVAGFDARGHGRSGGLSTLGDREVLDVDAVVAAARAAGYRRVVSCGWSLGGTSVLRHAALVGRRVHGLPVSSPVDAVVSVSATSRWFFRDTAPMRRVHWVAERPLGRLFGRWALGTRVSGDGWRTVPPPPLQLVADVAPVPLLFVHGDRDPYFPIEHARLLAARAREPVELWEVAGFAHGESGATPELVERIGAHLEVLLSRRPSVVS